LEIDRYEVYENWDFETRGILFFFLEIFPGSVF
jgi:hypothetical protein